MELAFVDVILSILRQNSAMLATLFAWILCAFIMFGGTVPFIPQYLEIKWTNNADGFSTFVCLTLIVANTLRILFWWGHPFELPLLVQSFVMIFSMMAMMHLCTTVKTKNEIISSRVRAFSVSREQQENLDMNYTPSKAIVTSRFSDFERVSFWRWTHFSSYVQCVAVFALGASILTYLLLHVHFYVEALGFLALFCEAMLGSPQFIQNIRNQTTAGMSIKMVLLWTAGDLCKTAYFIMRNAPVQFWVCGLLQVALDYAILIQVFYYAPAKSA